MWFRSFEAPPRDEDGQIPIRRLSTGRAREGLHGPFCVLAGVPAGGCHSRRFPSRGPEVEDRGGGETRAPVSAFGLELEPRPPPSVSLNASRVGPVPHSPPPPSPNEEEEEEEGREGRRKMDYFSLL